MKITRRQLRQIIRESLNEVKKKIEDVPDDTIKKEMMKMDEFDYEATYRWVIENKSSIPDWWIDMAKGVKKLGFNPEDHVLQQTAKKASKHLGRAVIDPERIGSDASKAFDKMKTIKEGSDMKKPIDNKWLKIAGIIK